MADIPQVPDPRDVGEWLWQQARRNGRPSVEILCSTRAVARIWQAVLAEVATPWAITVWLHAPKTERRAIGGNDTLTYAPSERFYEAIRVDVARG